MKVRANRDRRKTGLCEDYNSCCAYALDSLQSLFTDDQEVAAQMHKYPGSQYILSSREVLTLSTAAWK